MARRMHAAVAASLLVAVLAGCAASETEPEVEVESVGATPSATPEPSPEATTFTTQNGTASFTLPVGWSVDDTSYDATGMLPSGTQWSNVVAVLDADGDVRASYSDGYLDDVGASDGRELVRTVPMASGLAVATWTTSHAAFEDSPERWEPHALVVRDEDTLNTSIQLAPGERLHSFAADLTSVPECAAASDEASVLACLEAPGTIEAIEVLATLVLLDPPADAMPPGYEAAPEAWVEFATADGGVAFSHPASWTMLDQSGSGGPFVTLVTPDGFHALDVSTQADHPEFPFTSRCDVGDQQHGPWAVLERVSVDLLAGPLAGTTPALEAVTLEIDGLVIVSVLETRHVEAGCFEPQILVPGGGVRATTPYQTDAPGLIYEAFADPRGLVGSPEHDVIVDVLGTLRISSIDPA